MTTYGPDASLEELLPLIGQMSPEEYDELINELPEPAITALNLQITGPEDAARLPSTPLAQVTELDAGYRPRPHLLHLSDRIAQALRDVEDGHDRRLIVEMPPRSGKTTLATIFTPLWVLRAHPDWPIALTSHDGRLATSWGRQIRRRIEQHPLGIALARDAGAASEWETTAGGKVLSVSVRESFTGRGAKLLVIDDPHKDYADAHSAKSRQNVWDWWLTVAQMRLNQPALVIVIMTRWHEDDLVGRLLSREHEGSPADWERIRLPALADDPAADPLGRSLGEPLLSPLIEETPEQALARWEERRTAVGSYAWSALMQQNPAPAQGRIFNAEWWRFWTTDPSKATHDGRTIYLDPTTDLNANTTWLDSWDCSFKGTDDSDYVVGQRWARKGANRYLIAQQRGRWSFTATLDKMRAWGDGHGPYGSRVHTRLVEDKANGTAVIDTLKSTISGIIPINPTDSKTARARSVTPEIEAGNVYLPHPTDPGNEWVAELLAELREFDAGAHDDQVDALTQALRRMRPSRPGHFGNAGDRTGPVERNPVAVAQSLTRPIGGGPAIVRSPNYRRGSSNGRNGRRPQ